ncbi:hypothetical protein QAD02_021066 [Eretmocerus hayati]|uniref:Uncharacterized protein n=1 Tax=Eretmocerus hayati TaxID=131215 RepID=A0ACC2PQH7_9HYME|nr:hypothetical protein QAD02_021066 [Eretmocerus hayati]
MRILILGVASELIVVPDEFPSQYDGAFGTDFFLRSKARLNFHKKQLQIDERTFKFRFGGTSGRDKIPRINGIDTTGYEKRLPFLEVSGYAAFTGGYFLLDSGAEVNIVREGSIRDPKLVDTTKKIEIQGIGKDLISTQGTITLTIITGTSTFHVVPDDLQFPGEGILGAQYLSEALGVIDYETRCLSISGFEEKIILEPARNFLPDQKDIAQEDKDILEDFENSFGDLSMAEYEEFNRTCQKCLLGECDGSECNCVQM